MLVGMITINTCYGNARIPVELLGKGPRPDTAWVQALGGLTPFTRSSHGGPFQADTTVFPLHFVQDIHLEKELDEEPEVTSEEPANKEPIPAPDWFLESAYEDRTYSE